MIKRIENILFWAMVILLPFERLGTFELRGFTVKPAYLFALLLIGVFGVEICLKMTQGSCCKHIAKLPTCFITRLRTFRTEEYLLLGLVAWSYLSSLWSIAPLRTLVFSSLMLMMAMIFMFLRRKFNDSLRAKAESAIIVLGLIVSIIAILQLLLEHWFGPAAALLREQYGSRVFGFARPQATFLEPLYLANFLFWPIAFAINKISKIRFEKRDLVLLIVLLIAFILTLSRGAYLGLVVGLATCLLLAWKRLDLRLLSRLLLSAAAALAISAFIIFIVSGRQGITTFASQAVRSSDLTPSNETELLKNRQNSIENAQKTLKNHIFLGIGSDAFGALPEYQPLRDRGDWQTVNNEYLDWMVSLGLPGLLLFLSFLFLLLRHLIFYSPRDKRYYVIAVAAGIVQWLTFSGLNILYLWIMLALIWPASDQKVKINNLENMAPDVIED